MAQTEIDGALVGGASLDAKAVRGDRKFLARAIVAEREQGMPSEVKWAISFLVGGLIAVASAGRFTPSW
jgi:hypothetical protein